MNVELIKIPQDVAKAKLASYRKAIVARHHTKAGAAAVAEWEKIEAGYKAAAKGLPLIELSKAMAMGGWDDLGRPKFAVARAHRRNVQCVVSLGSSTARVRFETFGNSRDRRLEFVMPRPTVGAREQWARAIVPMVPPDVLARPDLDLSRRVILWEADWTAAPEDPLLLLPIGGDLYAVEAAWDLTPLERAVISGRAQ